MPKFMKKAKSKSKSYGSRMNQAEDAVQKDMGKKAKKY
jgi:hypothetical protein